MIDINFRCFPRNRLSMETDNPCDLRKVFKILLTFFFLACLVKVARTRYHGLRYPADNVEAIPNKPDEGKTLGLIETYKGLLLLCEDLSELCNVYSKQKEKLNTYVDLGTFYKGIIICYIICFIRFSIINISLEELSERELIYVYFGMVIVFIFLTCLDYVVGARYYVYICYIICFTAYHHIVTSIKDTGDVITEEVFIAAPSNCSSIAAPSNENVVFDKQVQERIDDLMAQEKKNLNNRVQELKRKEELMDKRVKDIERIEDLMPQEKKNLNNRVQELMRKEDLMDKGVKELERIEDLMAQEKKNLHKQVQEHTEAFIAKEKKNLDKLVKERVEALTYQEKENLDKKVQRLKRIEAIMAKEKKNLEKQARERTEAFMAKEKKNLDKIVKEHTEAIKVEEKKNVDKQVKERVKTLMAQEKENLDKQVKERTEAIKAEEKKNLDKRVAREKKKFDNKLLQKQIEFLEKQVDSLESSLECPVCLETASSPIYQCKESHLICRKCRPKVMTCPQCRLPYKGQLQRNRYAENVSCKLEKLIKEKLVLYDHV